MTAPHKICPQCGQPAVLEMTQCRRCGFAYAPLPPLASGVSPYVPASPYRVEVPGAQRAAQQRKRSAAPLILFAALGIGLLLFFGLARHAALLRAELSAGDRPGGSPLADPPADSASPPGKLSFFVESESRQEMPVLTFRNLADDTLTLTLRDRFGHVYRAFSFKGEQGTLQVPPGDYSVSVENNNPHVRPNWGDAAFRKFKAYHADFIEGHFDERIHLGE